MFISKNKVKCKICDDIIISDDSEKWEECSCGSVKIRGGKYFLQRVAKKGEYIELSTVDIPSNVVINDTPDNRPTPPIPGIKPKI